MTGLVRRATLFTAVGLVAAGAALAGVPSSGTSTIGNIIQLGGRTSAGVADVKCTKTITVRDAANNVVPNSSVVINFSTCYSNEIRIASPGATFNQTVNCGARTVSATTNASGVATFQVVGASNITTSGAVGAGEGCAAVSADGIPLGNLSVATPDLNGASGGGTAPGVDGQDTLIFNGNRWGGAGLYRPRANLIFNVTPPQAIDGQDTLSFNGYRWGGGSGNPNYTGASFCP